MSFSFGPPKADANPGGGFSFGANVGAGDSKASNTVKPLSFGTQQPSNTSLNLGGGFSLPGTAASTAPTFNLGGSSLQGGATPAPAAGGFSFAGPAAAPATAVSAATPSFNLSIAATAPNSGFGLLGTPKPIAAPATAAPLSGFTLGGTSSTANIGGGVAALSAAATTAPSSTSLGFGLGAAKSTAVASVAPTPSFSLSTTAAVKPTAASTGFSLTTTAATTNLTVATPTAVATGNLNFGQLVDAITKWTIDLEEQGKLFSNQAKQLNAWDRLLVSNGEKVMSLNSGIERVKQQQQQLDQELDFVHAQQKELEDLIMPLEKELSDIPLTDVDRLHTYQLAENMDTQLKQMSEDLKEIIEQLNESNKVQENSNPITQIRKILNAHMDSLQWIDRHTSKITGHLDQISKMHDLHRKSHEHSLKKTYD